MKKKSADNYLAVLRGLKAVLPILAEKLQEQVFIDIQNQTFEYLKMITGNSFESLFIKTESKGKRNYILKNITGFNMDCIDYLSDGTKDHLLFALRFAMIKQFSGNSPKFIILDEPFAHTDKT